MKKQVSILIKAKDLFGKTIDVKSFDCAQLSPTVSAILQEIYACNAFNYETITALFNQVIDAFNSEVLNDLDKNILFFCLDKLILVDRVLQDFEDKGMESHAEDVLSVVSVSEFEASSFEDDLLDFELSGRQSPSNRSDVCFEGEGAETDWPEDLSDGYRSASRSESESGMSEDHESLGSPDFDIENRPSDRLIRYIMKIIGKEASVPSDGSFDLTLLRTQIEFWKRNSPESSGLVDFLFKRVDIGVRVKTNRDEEDLTRERVSSLMGAMLGLSKEIPIAVQLSETRYGHILVQRRLGDDQIDEERIREICKNGDLQPQSFRRLMLYLLLVGANDAQAKNFCLIPTKEGPVLGMSDRKSSGIGIGPGSATVIQMTNEDEKSDLTYLPLAIEFLEHPFLQDSLMPEEWGAFKASVFSFVSIMRSIDETTASQIEICINEMDAHVDRMSFKVSIIDLAHLQYPMMYLASAVQTILRHESEETQKMSGGRVSRISLSQQYYDIAQQSIPQIIHFIVTRGTPTNLKSLLDTPLFKGDNTKGKRRRIESVSDLVVFCLHRAANLKVSKRVIRQSALYPILGNLKKEQGFSIEERALLLRTFTLEVNNFLEKLPEEKKQRVRKTSESHCY